MECQFQCGRVNVDQDEIKPYPCAPPRTTTVTATETKIYTSMKTETQVKFVIETVSRSIGYGPVSIPISSSSSTRPMYRIGRPAPTTDSNRREDGGILLEHFGSG